MLAINLDHIDAGTANTKATPSRPFVPCRPSRAGSLDKCRCRRPLRRAAAAAPENHHKRPEDSRGACHRLLERVWRVSLHLDSTRGEPVSQCRELSTPHHRPVDDTTPLSSPRPASRFPKIQQSARKLPGVPGPGILAFFSHARSLAHVTWASATLRGSLVLHPVTPQHRPGPRLALSAFALSLALAAATVAVRRVVPSCPPCCPEQGAFLGRGSTRLHANSGRRRSLLLPTSLVLLLLLGSACVRVAACCVLRALLENTERLVDSTPLLPSSHSSPSPDPPTYLLPPHPTPLLPGCDTLVAASFRG